MQGGDIDNAIPPRALVIFNDFLGAIPQNKLRHARVARRLHRWRDLVDLYDIDPRVRQYLHDLTWRRGVACDVVVIEESKSVRGLFVDRFNEMNLSISRVFVAADAQEIRDAKAYMPEVLWILHGNSEWNMAFGSFGRLGMSL